MLSTMRTIRRVGQLVNSTRCIGVVANFSTTIVSPNVRFSVAASREEAGPSTQSLDEKLMRRGDFHGVNSKNRRIFAKSNKRPEIELSRIQENLRTKARVTGDALFSIVQRLESNEDVMVLTLRKSADRWLPMLVEACGQPMSNLPRSTREIVLSRLWDQFVAHNIPISAKAYNARLRVLVENDSIWSPMEELAAMQKLLLEPTQETFHSMLERLANTGDIEGCKQMVYTMANHGCVVDAKCNTTLVYCSALRGHHAKADSLTYQAQSKYSEAACLEAHGACAKGAAARGNMNRLRDVLRRSSSTSISNDGNVIRKLGIPASSAFDVIWLLSEKNKQNYCYDVVPMVSQIVSYVDRASGFFRHLVREMDRHVAEEHYYTAVALMEDSIRVADCLQNQGSFRVFTEMFNRLSHQLIRNRVPIETVKHIADRVVKIESQLQMSVMYSNLMYDSMMLKELTMDDRIAYLSAFVDTVDPSRERPHLILPLLALSDEVEERLKCLFRCSNLGYKDISKLDITVLTRLILQPLHDKQRPRGNSSPLDATAKILKSFGSSDESIWLSFHAWMKKREDEEAQLVPKSIDDEPVYLRPHAKDLRGWLRFHHDTTFGNRRQQNKHIAPANTYARLKEMVETEKAEKVSNLLSSQGWPADTDFAEIVPPVIELFLELEDWPSIRRMLQSLSAQSSKWKRVGDTEQVQSPVTNVHLVSILRRMAQSAETIDTETVRGLIDTAYELSRLFPDATASQHDTFFSTSREYRRLFGACFKRLTILTPNEVDMCIELLRTLVKLNIIQLGGNEKVTCQFVEQALNKLGWDEALVTWMKMQSTFSSPNGIYVLLQYCLTSKNTVINHKMRIQHVMHRARNFMSESQLYALYSAVLVRCDQVEEAVEVLKDKKDVITANHSVHMMRLVNAINFPRISDQFMLSYPELCLTHSNLLDPETDSQFVNGMLQHCIQVCEFNSMTALALKTYDLFKRHSVDPGDDVRKRVWAMVEKKEHLLREWVYAPTGMLNVTRDDEIVTKRLDDVKSIQESLQAEIESMKSTSAI